MQGYQQRALKNAHEMIYGLLTLLPLYFRKHNAVNQQNINPGTTTKQAAGKKPDLAFYPVTARIRNLQNHLTQQNRGFR